MTARLRRLVFWGSLLAVLLAGLFFSFRPRPITVDMTMVHRGELVVTVDDEGETRVRDIYVLSAPVAGRMLRIDADVGDLVIASETIVAEIEPIDPAFLDPRSEAQARADVSAAESAESLARAEVDQAQAELDFAEAEWIRARELIREKTISQRELDDAERIHKTRRAALATARAALQVKAFELASARAVLLSPTQTQASHGHCECVPIRAPIDGRILQILHESESVVIAGQPLVEIGDPSDLEIVVELLSSDAVKVTAGQRVIVEGWGGDKPLRGQVQRVEPFGFTKISALGIEEQRVRVIVDFTSPRDDWQRLAHGYQVEARIVIWEDDSVLTLPLTALFREGDTWAVFAENEGRAELRRVEIGRTNGIEAEIVSGLRHGELVVLHPSDRVADGVRIVARS